MEASGGEAELRFSEHRRRLACVDPVRGKANFRTAGGGLWMPERPDTVPLTTVLEDIWAQA